MTHTPRLITTLGALAREQVGVMLAHEHVFANFAADSEGGATADAVVARMTPELERAKIAGVTALIEATAVGAARRPDVLLAVSQATNVPMVVATGLFKEPAKSNWVAAHDEGALRDWMIGELENGIGDTDLRAGWIKLSVTDSGVQPHERTLLRAAAGASAITGAAVGSHTVGGALANAELDIFEAAGGSPNRFIWIHTQTEPDRAVHLQFARRGTWIEYDAIDEDRADDAYLDLICHALDAGLGDHVLLSHDRVGYNPAAPNGGAFKPYSYLTEQFIPKLRARGADDGTIDQLLRVNPFTAYAR